MCTTSKRVASKLLTGEGKYVGRRSRGHISRVKQGTQGMLAREHVSSQDTLAYEYKDTHGMLAHEARKPSRHVEM